MLNRELLTTTIAGHGNIPRHQPISEAEVNLELPPRQLRDVKAIGYSTKTHTIICFHMEVLPILASCHILLFIQIRHLHVLPLLSRTSTSPAHTSPMAYVVEGGTY